MKAKAQLPIDTTGWNHRQKLGRTVLWEKAYAQQDGDTVAVFAPVALSQDIYLESGGIEGTPINDYTWLRATKVGESNWQHHLLTLVPMDNESTGFTGTAIVEDWFTGARQLALRENGRPTTMQRLRGHTIGKNNLSMNMVPDLECITYHYATCVTVYDFMGTGIPPVTNCTWHSEDICYVVDGGSMPGGGGAGSGGGGNGGNGDIYLTADIHNDLTDPCLKALLNEILGKRFVNRIGSILHEFNISENINLDFTDTNTLHSNIMAQYNPYASTDGRFQIDLNKNILPNASKEYATATIIHETIHAYLAKNNININFHHQEMFLKYRNTISDALVQMHSTSRQLADDLAFAGLTVNHQNYDWWDWYMTTMPQSTKNRILNTLYNHQDGTEGTKFCNP